MSDSATRALRVSFDGTCWLATDTDGNIIQLASLSEVSASGITLPELPEAAVVSSLLLPIESLLCKSFALPLAHTKFIDQEILKQELEEHSAEQDEYWWLVWQGGASSHGVAGLMFGLPETLREQIDAHEIWRQARYIGVDVWARLNARLRTRFEADPDMQYSESPVAVMDADMTGIYFGVWSGMDNTQSEDGFWHGMRRLNWDTALLEHQSAELAENIQRSLYAMGWENGCVTAIGQLPLPLQKALDLPCQGDSSAGLSQLPDRNKANLVAGEDMGLNFRHGRWKAESSLGKLKPWRRTLAFAAALAVIWITGMLWQNMRLGMQIEKAQQRIVAAFHKGLPNETVMIDALAQLHKAAGGKPTGAGNRDAAVWLQQIVDVHRVYQQIPWTIRVLSFHDGMMTMSGIAKDLQTMNRIREALQKQTGKDVKLEDTDLSGNRVKFRMAWS